MPAVTRAKHVEGLSANLAVTSTETTVGNAVNFPLKNAEPGRIGQIELHGTTLVTAATLSIRCFRDALCDQEVVPLTPITLSLGKTDPTKWSATLVLDALWPGGATNLYLVAKTDAGTLTIVAASSFFVWEE